AVEYLYNVNLELCCEIYDEYKYDEFEYVAGIPLITLKALSKANLDSKKNESKEEQCITKTQLIKKPLTSQ
ncbi:12041_t:CDS:2, partial [Gigaspora rosea]